MCLKIKFDWNRKDLDNSFRQHLASAHRLPLVACMLHITLMMPIFPLIHLFNNVLGINKNK